jgi:hypothetical protein
MHEPIVGLCLPTLKAPLLSEASRLCGLYGKVPGANCIES